MSITLPPPVSAPEPTPAPGTAAPTAAMVLAVLEQTQALWAGLGTVSPDRFTDDDLLGVLGAFEGVGRLVDAGRVAVAATVEERSGRWLGRDSLAAKRGCTSGIDLITRVTRVSGREAKRRSALGLRMRDTQHVGTIIPALFPTVGAAVASGLLGVDAAEVIMSGLAEISPRVAPDDLAAAERALVSAATGTITAENEGEPGAGFAFSADSLRVQMLQWQAALDPDGVAPNEVEGEATSTISFGRFKDGVYPVRGGVTPDLYGIMNLTFDAFIAARKTPAFPTAAEQARDEARDDRAEHDDRAEQDAHDGPDGHDLNDERDREYEYEYDDRDHERDDHERDDHDHDHDDHDHGSASAEAPLPGSAGHEFDDVDTRTAGEKRADILRGMFTQLAQADNTPSIGGAPPTVVVHVNVNDIEAGRGVGWIDGVDAPISLRTVDQMMCAGGTQTVLFGPNGEVLTLTDPQRLFNRAQRRAILARDGGCGIPGCDAPTQWLEFHHVIPWSKGGVTEVDNGVALCWRHHHTIETSGWEILMVNGRPQVKAPAWIDPTRTWRDAHRHRTDTHRRN
ncbi:HNH endonuclease signature motif containing protein [Glaciibacter psychrotolerans]|uniref:HNH nuclease domain-containing protein n=1 Tax=Glaciibacter psychrotolerans TaxID=670054 RepID=A0A7Z0J4Q7_9MICO|nr:HNH endonuclease signature motif containing protein [Leifsonia psychrotolerans]NYJ18590.1 hypothetical protein [Leifsonia psychrotolerans]